MTTKDITYGIQAELWPRDYTNVEKLLMFWRREQIPVRVTLEDGGRFACTFMASCHLVTKLTFAQPLLTKKIV